MNSVQLIGRVTKDIELKKVNDQSIVNFTLAVTRDYKNASGEYDSDFINCYAYQFRADFMNQYVRKGDRIAIEGAIRTGSYTNQKQEKVYTTGVSVDKVQLLESKKESKQEKPQEEPTPTSDPFQEFADEVVIRDEDLPF